MDDKEAKRVEWQRPDSGSDIHLSMLSALATIYAMVDATCKEQGTDTMPRRRRSFSKNDILKRMDAMLPMPAKEAVGKTNEERIAQFETQSAVLKMMTQLVQDVVPAEEQKHYLGLIEEFTTAVVRQSRQQFAEPRVRLVPSSER